MDYYDDLETRDPEAREAALFAQLPAQIRNARSRAAGFRRLLAGVEPGAVTSRSALAALPVLRKSELIELQRSQPPFGVLATIETGEASHVFTSPGPIYEIRAARADYGLFARSLFAAGFRRGELIHNGFSYHLTPAGLMVDSAARALGCAVFPAGVGQTEMQISAISHLRPNGYVGTPSHLKILLEKAADLGADRSSLRKGLVSGEALPPSLRAQFRSEGVAVLQCYTTADLGVIAYESEAADGLVVNEGLIVEIVRPGTGDPLPAGEVGEVVVTTTVTPEYPLIRFATGDLSATLPGPSPCGRTNVRLKGWLGRADQSTKVRGMFVTPSQIAQILRRHPEILRARLVVSREDQTDAMTLRCETRAAGENLGARIGESIREVCNLRGAVEIVPPGSLPNDGKVIEDIRRYE